MHVAGGVPVSCGFKGRITKKKAREGRHVCFGKQLGQKPAPLVDSTPPPLKSPGLLWVQIERVSPMSLGHFNTGKGTFFWA